MTICIEGNFSHTSHRTTVAYIAYQDTTGEVVAFDAWEPVLYEDETGYKEAIIGGYNALRDIYHPLSLNANHVSDDVSEALDGEFMLEQRSTLRTATTLAHSPEVTEYDCEAQSVPSDTLYVGVDGSYQNHCGSIGVAVVSGDEGLLSLYGSLVSVPDNIAAEQEALRHAAKLLANAQYADATVFTDMETLARETREGNKYGLPKSVTTEVEKNTVQEIAHGLTQDAHHQPLSLATRGTLRIQDNGGT